MFIDFGADVDISGVEFVDIQTVGRADAIDRARRHYVNRSSNHESFEFFCFERVFILRGFLEARRTVYHSLDVDATPDHNVLTWQARGLERCFHLDSDCCLLRSLDDFPLYQHRVWLVNNYHYHTHGITHCACRCPWCCTLPPTIR